MRLNKGVEITLKATPILTNKFRWSSELNYSKNSNRVRSLCPELPAFIFGNEGFSSSYSMRLVEGGAFGDIYGKAFKRDDAGEIVYATDGLPEVIGDGNTAKVGNCNPDFLLGWNNEFTYKDWTVSFLIDAHIGGDFLSQTQAILDETGVSAASGNAREEKQILLEGDKITNVMSFYEYVGGRNGVTEYYMYDASNIRLREFALVYKFPAKWVNENTFFKHVRCSFVARNLFFIYKNAPVDPDMVLSTGNDNQGIDVFGQPATRNIGFNIKVTI